MKESISYTFLLNIVIIFIFTCFAIVMGILSYYKAFRANTIISETIEKYEGYNCLSAEEIARKLGNIGYNTPFEVNCNRKGDYCMTDTNHNYAIVSYNLDKDIPDENIVYKERTDEFKDYVNMNSTYKCDEDGCVTNKNYQYGVYTYMYTELPVISSLIRIPVFSKTSIMYEFRNFYVISEQRRFGVDTSYIDTEALYSNLYSKKYANNKVYVKDNYEGVCADEDCMRKGAKGVVAQAIMDNYLDASTTNSLAGNQLQAIAYFITGEAATDYRTRMMTTRLGNQTDGLFDAVAASNILASKEPTQKCGYITDYSKIN